MMKYLDVKKRKEMKQPLLLLGISICIILVEILRELSSFCIRRYEIKSNKLTKEIKFVFLSDLHGRRYGENNCKLCMAVKKEHPDLILVGGDMLVRAEEDTDEIALEIMKELVEIAPVYLANGNHEQRMRVYPEKYDGRYEKYKNAVESLGVKVLENSSVVIPWNDAEIEIHGLEFMLMIYLF